MGRLGLKVGLLDADIYGPSLPRLLAITEKPGSTGNTLLPIEKHGLKTMSIGFLVKEDEAMIWRGPMVQSALSQMLSDVAWATPGAPLDVLVLDMPPGTGDAQLTIAQRVPLKGAVDRLHPAGYSPDRCQEGHRHVQQDPGADPGHCRKHVHVHLSRLRLLPTPSSVMAARAKRPKSWACRSWARFPLVPRIRETSDAGTPVSVSDTRWPGSTGLSGTGEESGGVAGNRQQTCAEDCYRVSVT